MDLRARIDPNDTVDELELITWPVALLSSIV
jgi:hypothetical protein